MKTKLYTVFAGSDHSFWVASVQNTYCCRCKKLIRDFGCGYNASWHIYCWLSYISTKHRDTKWFTTIAPLVKYIKEHDLEYLLLEDD